MRRGRVEPFETQFPTPAPMSDRSATIGHKTQEESMTIATANRRMPAGVLGHSISTATSAAQAIDLAGLNWGLKIVNANDFAVREDLGEGRKSGWVPTSMPGQRFVMRDDNWLTLGAVGGIYEAIDNRQVFGLADPLLAQGARFEYGGEQDHGRQVFMRLGLPGLDVKLNDGRDLIKFGVTLLANHAGKGKVIAKVEAVRMWCTNGCTTTLRGLPNHFEIRHTASAEARLAEAREVMAGAAKYASGFSAVAERMLSIKMDEPAFIRYIDALYPRPEEEGRKLANWETRRGELLALFKFATTNNLEGMGQSGWAAFNSVTEHIDWGGTRNVSEEQRARRQFREADQDVKDRALQLVLAA